MSRVRTFATAAALAALAAASASARDEAGRLVWVERPDADDMARFYPPAALEADLNGYAVLRCRVGEDGGLEACVVVREEPEGEQFGAAALAMAWSFKAEVPAGGGGPVGEIVDVPIRFQTVDPAPPTPAEAAAAREEGERAFAFVSRVLLAWFGVLTAIWAALTAVLVVWPMRSVLRAAGVSPRWAYLYLVPGFGLFAPWLVAGRLGERGPDRVG